MDTITGYVEHIIYRNDENGYTVFNFISEDEEIVCIGNFQMLDAGENLELSGTMIQHPEYGEQFKVSSYELTTPSDAQSMERYLGSGAIRGIGEALAKRIVKKFGDKTFEIIEKEPERLSEIKGISERKAREIAIQVFEKKDARDAMVFLQQYGISNTMAIRIYERYGLEIYGILRENPYRLAEDISGIGFKMADEIAHMAGIQADSEFRIRSGIIYALSQAVGEGHMYLPKEDLLRQAGELLELTPTDMEMIIENLAMDRKLIIKKKEDQEQIYTPTAYYAELNSARMLHDLNLSLGGKDGLDFEEEEKYRKKIKDIEKKLGLELDELQRAAVMESIKHGISILSGGPGTGKTTTINVMIQYFLDDGLDIMLAAPTGRAAKRMTEATGYEARTIHRMLELNGALMQEERAARFERNEENPLEADVIIIDEMSMVDAYLFQALLKAVSVGTRLVLVGDVNQLPSVGPGQVLYDLIESGRFSVTLLQKIFRQAEESDIVMNAHRIHAGKQIALDNKSKDFFFLERSDVQVIYKHMVQLITEKLPRYVSAGTYDIQVLTPSRKGPLGVEQLNQILQQYLNPPAEFKKEYEAGKTLFREGDKVMQIKNNYQAEWEIEGARHIVIDSGTGVFNGDIGIIREINQYSRTVVVEYDEKKKVTYGYSQLDELELAYAVTIHKSQGSEYPAVVMPLLTGPKMLFNRNLLYTAITRAKNCVTILGSSEVVRRMIDNNFENKRNCGFCDRIREFV